MKRTGCAILRPECYNKFNKNIAAGQHNAAFGRGGGQRRHSDAPDEFTDRPCTLTKGGVFMYSKILVPVDGSALAEAVLPHVKALTTLSHAGVVLLRVTLIPAAEFTYPAPMIPSDLISDMEAQASAYLATLRARLEREGLVVETIHRQGPVAETILEVAHEVGADLIAMSTHGRSGVQRWLLGSTADRVVNHASIPVLMVRSK